jgi:L-ascorbate metabolism protein UlaG (beta-lactamase superfamily)
MPLMLQSDVLPFLLAPGARHRNDASAADDTNWARAGVELPQGLSLQWLGTAGFAIRYEGTTILTDPFVTRRPLPQVARGPFPSDAALVEQLVPACDAILMGHTHFDHAVDAPTIARRDGCTVYGSTSMTRLMNLAGLGEQAVTVQPRQAYEIGPFVVRFVPSVHSKLALGLAVPQGGEITCESLDGMVAKQYCCGQVWGIHIEVAGTSLYHMGSCDLIDDAGIPECEFFLAGIAGRGNTPKFWQRILSKVKPRVIVPHHHDNFFLPLGAPMGFSFNVNYGSMLHEVRAVDPDVTIAVLNPLQET